MLQKYAIEKIRPVGLDRILTVLLKTAEKSDPIISKHFNNMYIYFSMIEDVQLDMENDFTDFKCRCEYVLTYLKAKVNLFNEDVFNVLIDIYTYNLEYVSNIKKLG